MARPVAARSTRLGRLPLYAQFQGSASYLDLVRPNSYAGKYGRVDVFPQLTLPIRSVPWLNLSLTAGECCGIRSARVLDGIRSLGRRDNPVRSPVAGTGDRNAAPPTMCARSAEP